MNNRKTMHGFLNLTPIDKALKTVYSFSGQIKLDFVSLKIMDSLNRINFEDVTASRDVPEFDRTVVDGYALNYEHTISASASNPIEFNLSPRIEHDYDAVEVYTGNALPPNANAIAMAEDVELIGQNIRVLKPMRKFENISMRGEDFKKGETIIRARKIIMPHHIAALSAMGINQVKVVSKLKIGVLVTGTELTGEAPKVQNSTGPFILSLLSKPYIEPVDLGVVEDNIEYIRQKVESSIEKLDILITTGGTSLGRKDYVPDILDDIGEVYFNGVNSRPGKTAGFAIVKGKPVFFVSGFPVAAMVSFDIFIWPFVKYALKIEEPREYSIEGFMTRKVANPSGVRSYLRVFVYKDGDLYKVEPLRITGSGILSTLTKANGMLIIPEQKEGLEENEKVTVNMFDKVGDSR